MTQCWGEGELRAWLDRELPAGQALAVEQHLAECAACTAVYQTLAARAERVSTLMEALSADIPAHVAPVRRTISRPAVWATVAALAAALVLAVLLSERPAKAPVQAIVPPPPVPAPLEVPMVSAPLTTLAITEAPPRPHVRRVQVRPVRPSPVQYYMALDEEPIETGLVMRVALPSGIQADVIVDGDGRARAIRPIQYVSKEYEP